MACDFVIVGAGFSDAVSAERLARAGKKVLLLDRRPYVGGNARDEFDEHGVLIHLHGPHIFHTKSERIFNYLGGFTKWRFYEHRVLAESDGGYYPLPINRTTINELYHLDLDEAGVEAYLERVRVPIRERRTSEDVVLSRVGEDLCNRFFRGYTRKQWGLELSQLAASVAGRIPSRTNDDDRFFDDPYQFMPAEGYARLFENLLASANIEVQTSAKFADLSPNVKYGGLIYTGPIDTYFDYRFGALPYRSLRFEHRFLPLDGYFQRVGTVNFPGKHPYTRITEFKHLTGQKIDGTSIVYEFPQDEGEPYYPVPNPENRELFRRYDALAKKELNVHFVGRLAQYQYYNMDQAVGAALALTEQLLA